MVFDNSELGRACHNCIIKALQLTGNRTRSLRHSNSLSSTHNKFSSPKFTAVAGAVATTACDDTTTTAITSSTPTATHPTSSQMDRIELILAEIDK